jgi:hypothetical protein
MFIAARHFGDLEASVKQLGSVVLVLFTAKRALGSGYLMMPGYNCLGLTIFARLLVCIGCLFSLSAGQGFCIFTLVECGSEGMEVEEGLAVGVEVLGVLCGTEFGGEFDIGCGIEGRVT